ncbi:MAG: permease [Pseudomonadota bacterium]
MEQRSDKKTNQGSDAALYILGALIVAAVAFSLFKGGWELTFLGLKNAGVLFEKVWVRLLLGFLLGGFIQVLIPRNLISKWLGAGSGIKGILLASYASMFATGGPYVWLPIVVSIYRAGADVGPVLSLMTARGILSLQMLIVWQIPFFGAGLSFSRYIPCLLVPPLIGLSGRALFRLFGWSTLSAQGPDDPDQIMNGGNAPAGENTKRGGGQG